MTNRDRLKAMFADLRRRGYLARQRFLCCGGCASAQLADDLRKRPEKLGAVYYHRQEAERLDRGQESVYLSYGRGQDASPEQSALVGEAVARAAGRAGLAVLWDGESTSCVQVMLPGGLDAEAAS
jgi:alkylhydroperoxidase family enzyme